ncbi:MAG: hypothetical protein QXK76_03870, partial [Candidatus Woesearchaeota archaeon]
MNKTYNSNMIINEKESLELKNQGYKAMDPHCHSSYSYDVPNSRETSPKSIVKLQQKKGLIPIITDHDTSWEKQNDPRQNFPARGGGPPGLGGADGGGNSCSAPGR